MGDKFKGLKVGDRVRITLESEITYFDREGDWVDAANNTFRRNQKDVVSVEKLEPPVEVFGPGDVVRLKALPRYTFHIGRGGYLDRFHNSWRAGAASFTSEAYDRVELVEKPF